MWTNSWIRIVFCCSSLFTFLENEYQVIAVKSKDKDVLSAKKQDSSKMHSSIVSASKKEPILLDLNLPPPPSLADNKNSLESVRHEIGTEGKKGKSRYTKQIEKLSKAGELEEFRKKEKERVDAYRKSLPPDKRRAQTLKHQSNLQKKIALVCQIQKDMFTLHLLFEKKNIFFLSLLI